LGNALSRPGDREAFVEVLDLVRSTPVYRIVPATTQAFTTAAEHFRSRMDKEWSLTDCSSMCVMRESGLQQILTGDHHFTQAGFEVLLS
jgi:predicted nucleic acid-binding protein